MTVAVDLLLCIIPWHRKNLPVMCRLWPSLTLTKLTSMTTNPPCSHNPPLHSGTRHSNVPWRCPGVSSTALHVVPWNLCPLPISQKTLRYKLWFSCCPPTCRSPGLVLRWEDLGYILWGGPLLLDFFFHVSFSETSASTRKAMIKPFFLSTIARERQLVSCMWTKFFLHEVPLSLLSSLGPLSMRYYGRTQLKGEKEPYSRPWDWQVL